MKTRFLADNDLNRGIVSGVVCKEPSIDFKTAQEAGLDGLEDLAVLEIAAREDRVLVTHDFKTMPRAFATFLAENRSPGVLIVPQQMPVAHAIEALVLIWAASEASEWSNSICRIPL